MREGVLSRSNALRRTLAVYALCAALAGFADPPAPRAKLPAERVQALMNVALANPTNGYQCDDDYCFVRADLFARELIRAGADPNDIQKILVRYPQGKRWRYHIATMYDGKVVDPNQRTPKTPEEWAKAVNDGDHCEEGDVNCQPSGSTVRAIVPRQRFSLGTVESFPEAPMPDRVRQQRREHIEFLYEESGEDFSQDPRRVDDFHPDETLETFKKKRVAKRLLMRAVLPAAVAGYVYYYVKALREGSGQCPAQYNKLAGPPERRPLERNDPDDEPRRNRPR